MNIWVVFLALQIMDCMTTLMFLMLGLGVKEINPLLNFFICHFGAWRAMVFAKLIPAVIIVIVAWRFKKSKIIVSANYFYIALVLYNMFVILVSVSARS